MARYGITYMSCLHTRHGHDKCVTASYTRHICDFQVGMTHMWWPVTYATYVISRWAWHRRPHMSNSCTLTHTYAQNNVRSWSYHNAHVHMWVACTWTNTHTHTHTHAQWCVLSKWRLHVHMHKTRTHTYMHIKQAHNLDLSAWWPLPVSVRLYVYVYVYVCAQTLIWAHNDLFLCQCSYLTWFPRRSCRVRLLSSLSLKRRVWYKSNNSRWHWVLILYRW